MLQFRSKINYTVEKSSSSTLLPSLCCCCNDVIASGSGIGWTKPFSDPVAGLLPYFQSQAIASNVSLIVAYDTTTNTSAGSVQLCDNIDRFRSEACAHRAEVSCFFVSPSLRGSKIGYGLLKKAEEVARGMGIKKLTLDCRESQVQAIKLYERYGFKRYGTMERYASLDGVVFQKGYYYDFDL
ncbi:hypothetical protein TrCOL_g1015 [Triparma columacea]|uniref:N-acetyltransferase domain-containing protein n=1 Tax=Triparma columacea TaxID=722753 RepID=A0A9W7LEG8_9STRA|nr:hypothetical protein TrCOL_g1015 [Triparma columacea]